jgi:hypothetical protein
MLLKPLETPIYYEPPLPSPPLPSLPLPSLPFPSPPLPIIKHLLTPLIRVQSVANMYQMYKQLACNYCIVPVCNNNIVLLCNQRSGYGRVNDIPLQFPAAQLSNLCSAVATADQITEAFTEV